MLQTPWLKQSLEVRLQLLFHLFDAQLHISYATDFKGKYVTGTGSKDEHVESAEQQQQR